MNTEMARTANIVVRVYSAVHVSGVREGQTPKYSIANVATHQSVANVIMDNPLSAPRILRVHIMMMNSFVVIVRIMTKM